MAFMLLFLFFVFLQASRESVRAMLFLVQQLNALCQVRCRAVLYPPDLCGELLLFSIVFCAGNF